jgi:hypothetical protein
MNRFTFAGLMLFALLLVAPIASAQEGLPGCPWGYYYNPITHDYVLVCLNRSAAPESSAPKAAGLAAPAQAAQQNQGWPGCQWGAAYDPTEHGFIAECFWQPADNAAAAKTAGLAKLAPAEKFDPCGFSEQLDPLLDPLALACLSQPDTAAKAASKPAGLAQPAPTLTAKQDQAGQGCPSGYAYNLIRRGYPGECLPEANSAVSAAPKSAGLAAPAQVEKQDQGWPGCPPGYFYHVVRPGYPGECFPEAISTVSAASKPAGLAAPAQAQEQFGPCGSSGESPDPLAWPLACLR